MRIGEEFTVRQMVPKDFANIALVHKEAFPKSFLTKLGKGATKRYYKWQYFGPHSHYSIVAELKGKIVGFCVGGVSRGSLIGFLKKYKFYLFMNLLTKFWLLFNKELFLKFKYGVGLFLKKVFSSEEKTEFNNNSENESSPESYGILAICVLPTVQGMGVAKVLMEESEREALRRGFKKMHLTVAGDNTRAINFYQKLGYLSNCKKSGKDFVFMEKELKS